MIAMRHTTVDIPRTVRVNPLLTFGIPAAERLATFSRNKLMYPKIGAFKIVEILPSTVSMDKDGISNTVSIDHTPLVPTLISINDIGYNVNSDKKSGLPTDPI